MTFGKLRDDEVVPHQLRLKRPVFRRVRDGEGGPDDRNRPASSFNGRDVGRPVDPFRKAADHEYIGVDENPRESSGALQSSG